LLDISFDKTARMHTWTWARRHNICLASIAYISMTKTGDKHTVQISFYLNPLEYHVYARGMQLSKTQNSAEQNSVCRHSICVIKQCTNLSKV